MPIIVRDELKLKLYVLIGTGFGESKALRHNPMLPLKTTTTGSSSELVALAGPSGEISWLPSNQLTVFSVDGRTCSDLLQEASAELKKTLSSR